VSLTSAWTIDPAGAEPALRGETVAESSHSQQQVMMMLAQLLGTMHSDHMTLVRDELAEIRRLAEEMQALRAEIGRRPAEAPARAALSSAATAPVPPEGELLPDMEPPMPRDPRECLAIASDFLAEYERKQNGYLNRMLRVIKGFTQGSEPAPGPLDPAPLR
jgi:hypothetical protein